MKNIREYILFAPGLSQIDNSALQVATGLYDSPETSFLVSREEGIGFSTMLWVLLEIKSENYM